MSVRRAIGFGAVLLLAAACGGSSVTRGNGEPNGGANGQASSNRGSSTTGGGGSLGGISGSTGVAGTGTYPVEPPRCNGVMCGTITCDDGAAPVLAASSWSDGA